MLLNEGEAFNEQLIAWARIVMGEENPLGSGAKPHGWPASPGRGGLLRTSDGHTPTMRLLSLFDPAPTQLSRSELRNAIEVWRGRAREADRAVLMLVARGQLTPAERRQLLESTDQSREGWAEVSRLSAAIVEGHGPAGIEGLAA